MKLFYLNYLNKSYFSYFVKQKVPRLRGTFIEVLYFSLGLSNSFATSFKSSLISRCCGHTASHLPHFMQSDAFFPFADTVEQAIQGKIGAIIQPGGSIRDEDSIRACNDAKLPMIFTGVRHFKH